MIFRSAITGRDGSVDPGYLAIFWTMATTVTMIPVCAIFCAFMCLRTPENAEKIISSAAMLVGALGVQCGAVIGAVGMYRMGDKPNVPDASSKTVVTPDSTTVTT